MSLVKEGTETSVSQLSITLVGYAISKRELSRLDYD